MLLQCNSFGMFKESISLFLLARKTDFPSSFPNTVPSVSISLFMLRDLFFFRYLRLTLEPHKYSYLLNGIKLQGLVVHSSGEGNGTPLQYSCLENPMDGRAWQAAVHEVAKSRTRLSDFTFTFHFHALEKDMVTHSSVLAQRIPGTGEPGGLPFMGLHRVGHD